jgi:hypothetical protein
MMYPTDLSSCNINYNRRQPIEQKNKALIKPYNTFYNDLKSDTGYVETSYTSACIVPSNKTLPHTNTTSELQQHSNVLLMDSIFEQILDPIVLPESHMSFIDERPPETQIENQVNDSLMDNFVQSRRSHYAIESDMTHVLSSLY